MGIRYKIIPEKKLVFCVGEGKVTCDDLYQHIEAIANDTLYTAPMKKLVDYTKSEVQALSVQEMLRVKEQKIRYQDIFADETCALVETYDVDYGMARFLGTQMESSSIKVRVFRKLEDAIDWLEIDFPESERQFD